MALRVEETDLWSLTGADREAAMAGLTSSRELPFVIVEGVLACAGDFDVQRIEDAVRSAASA